MFRIALGRCDCGKPYRDSIQELACGAVEARLDEWRRRLPADLGSVPTEHYETERVEGRWISFSTLKVSKEDGATLVVVAALVHTWSKPSFISLGAVGRLFAEGLVVAQDGSVNRAPDDVMWEFR